MNITDAERANLAALYSPGQSLWRSQIMHFTAWGKNMRTSCVEPCTVPAVPTPFPSRPSCESTQSGSIIGCQGQTLGQVVDLVGAPFQLTYHSDRELGGNDKGTLQIPLSGNSISPTLREIGVEIQIAGRDFQAFFGPSTNLSYVFRWDGRDAYGRLVQGQQPVVVRIGYGYKLAYARTDRFGYNGNGSIGVTRGSFVMYQSWHGALGAWDSLPEGLGGWSLSANHVYDPVGHTLYLGTGEQRGAALSPVIATSAGSSSTTGFAGDGGPATQARLFLPFGVAVAPDKTLYIADTNNFCVRRVAVDGIITTYAGGGHPPPGTNGDGGAATTASLFSPQGVSVGPFGDLYIADGNTIRRVDSTGVITTVVGTGAQGFSGDGGPATAARLSSVRALAFSSDGSMYIADTANDRVRRVGTDGIITTVAGNGGNFFGPDNVPATQTVVRSPLGVAVGLDGSLYISDSSSRVHKVAPSGIITTVAGNATQCFNGPCGDGGPAKNSVVWNPTGIAVAPDGSITFADGQLNRLRRIGSDGIITAIAGVCGFNCGGFSGDNGPASASLLNAAAGVALAPDGTIYVADQFNNRVRGVAGVLPGVNGRAFVIPAADGSETYTFDRAGRHLQTLDGLTGAMRYQFGYDTAGRLATVADPDGNITTVQHDAAGNPTAISAPFGQTTSLAVDANGYLSRIANPNAEVTALISSGDGLLLSLTDPRGGSAHYGYDSLGRLTFDRNAAGSTKTLSRTYELRHRRRPPHPAGHRRRLPARQRGRHACLTDCPVHLTKEAQPCAPSSSPITAALTSSTSASCRTVSQLTARSSFAIAPSASTAPSCTCATVAGATWRRCPASSAPGSLKPIPAGGSRRARQWWPSWAGWAAPATAVTPSRSACHQATSCRCRPACRGRTSSRFPRCTPRPGAACTTAWRCSLARPCWCGATSALGQAAVNIAA